MSTLEERIWQIVKKDSLAASRIWNHPQESTLKAISEEIQSELETARREWAEEIRKKIQIAIQNQRDSSMWFGLSWYEEDFCDELSAL